jgi:glycine/D-amino acid oxidase-like deaminating enzyme
MSRDGPHLVIVGAGITGLLAALRCALAGHRVTVLDRGTIPNPTSTSYDQHRVVRALDPDDLAATRRIATADRRWRELEALLGTRFYHRVGVLAAWPAGKVDQVRAVAADAGIRVDAVAPADYPHLGFPPGSVPMVERDAGVLLAERVLRVAARWLDRHPSVTLRPGQRVVDVDLKSATVVLSDGATLEADLTLIAAGPWSSDLVDLPTVLHRQTTVYLRPPADLLPWWERAPAASRLGVDGRGWLTPPVEGTLLKLSSAAACRNVAELAGDVGAGTVVADHPEADDDLRAATRILTASTLTDIERYDIVKVGWCHYTVDPATGGGRLAQVGRNVWARAASGGDGFRTAPLTADRIADLVTRSGTMSSPRRREADERRQRCTACDRQRTEAVP